MWVYVGVYEAERHLKAFEQISSAPIPMQMVALAGFHVRKQYLPVSPLLNWHATYISKKTFTFFFAELIASWAFDAIFVVGVLNKGRLFLCIISKTETSLFSSLVFTKSLYCWVPRDSISLTVSTTSELTIFLKSNTQRSLLSVIQSLLQFLGVHWQQLWMLLWLLVNMRIYGKVNSYPCI